MPHLNNVQPVRLVIADPPPDCEGAMVTSAGRLLVMAMQIPSLSDKDLAVRSFPDGWFVLFVDGKWHSRFWGLRDALNGFNRMAKLEGIDLEVKR